MFMHVLTEFIELINDHNTIEMASYMSDDHIYTNADDIIFNGREQTLDEWKRFFDLFPDYWIDIHVMAETETAVLACGNISGTYRGYISGEPHHFFRIPAAFHVMMRDEKIISCMVYANMKKVEEILERN